MLQSSQQKLWASLYCSKWPAVDVDASLTLMVWNVIWIAINLTNWGAEWRTKMAHNWHIATCEVGGRTTSIHSWIKGLVWAKSITYLLSLAYRYSLGISLYSIALVGNRCFASFSSIGLFSTVSTIIHWVYIDCKSKTNFVWSQAIDNFITFG